MADPRYTLLFVDDEPNVIDVLRRTFERRYNVLTTCSADEGLAILKSQPIDVLVTDQRMPEMTGIEMVAAAREAGVDVTAILLTGYTEPEDIIAAINKGQVFRYLTKPWDVNDLMLTVRSAIEFTQLRRDKDRLLRQLHKRVEALSVFYEVSRQSAGGPPTYDAIVDNVLSAVYRVLPYDCGAALIAVDEGKSATLRLECHSVVSDKGLLWVKDAVLSSYRKVSGVLLPEDRVLSRVAGSTTQDVAAPSAFTSQLAVPLVAHGRPVGTLALFSQRPSVYSAEDGELLDILANQTTDAILALRASEEEARRRIERMVESMADGVVLTDEKNQIVVLNPSARRMLQLPDDPQQWSARHLQDILGFYPFELVRGWEYSGSKVYREELKLYDRAVQCTITPVADTRGTLRGVCVVLHDVTEQKQLDERKEEFVSIISHELRTPLTSITGALDLVLNFLAGDINEKQQRYLEMAKESTEKLNAIVDDLLDLSRFSKGRLRMSFELTYLNELVRAAVEKYGPAFMEKRFKVDTHLPPSAVRALADPNRISQVLNNLLTNAVKFTPEDGQVELQLRAPAEVPGFVTLCCRNSGEGIPEADLERIFDKFEQARTERTRTVRGTGLGLAISRGIVEGHGGRMWAEPSSEGACFVVVLPKEPPQALLAPEGAEPEPRERVQRPARGTVLVVEAQLELGYALKALLLLRGYRVVLTQTAEDAVGKARRLHPELILLDVRLPGPVGGLGVAEILRHDPDTRQAPILVLSETDERQRAFRQGANAFLGLPLEKDKFYATVDALVRGRSGRPQSRVLVVDDDEKISAICTELLANMGFDVSSAGTLAEARRLIRERRPEVLLLDVGLPDGDGFTFLEELKAERASSHISVIFISARSEPASKVRALKLGGEDYLTKPFDALELGARVEQVIRRREQEMGSSPTTQLPGSAAIEREVQRRLQARTPFAFCYLDLDNLKAYNDYYGYAKADGVVRQTGDLLRESIAEVGASDDFAGHVAGDDFVFITDVSTVDAVCQRTIDGFDRIIPLYYDRQDREAGYIETYDRFGERRRFPIMSVSIVAVICDGASADHAELARRAADMKKRAKAIQGSVYLRSDRERGNLSIA